MRARTLTLGLLIAGCGPSLTQATRDVDAHNETSSQRLMRRVAEAGTPLTPASIEIQIAGATPDPYAPAGAPPSTAPMGSPAATAGALGLVESEKLYRVGDQLAFVGGMCAERAACGAGCGMSAEYRYARAADGHLVILRIRPIVSTVRVKVDQCGSDCGGVPPGREPHPPAMVTGALLDVRSLDQVEVRDLGYPLRRVDTWCANPEPRP